MSHGAFESNEKIKLLLHTRDGSLPYLSDYLLQTYFHPSSNHLVKDHLTLGISVKDTCVVPLYRSSKGSNAKDLKRKRSTTDTCGQDEFNDVETKSNNAVMKPHGYTFDAESINGLTRTLSAYRTMAVPTFDLFDDAWSFRNAAKKESGNNQNNISLEKKVSNGGECLPTIASSNHKISLTTPNGMQQISPSNYAQVGMKLHCNSILTLFDQAHPEDSKKRKKCASERTKEWLEICLSTWSVHPDSKHTYLWGALPCLDSQDLLLDSIEDLIINQPNQLHGVALIGWHHIRNRDKRIQVLKKVSKQFSNETELCVLAASTLEQIIDAAKNGVRTIGTSLPATWALMNKGMVMAFDSLDQNDCKLTEEDGCIDLSNHIYRKDMSPILAGCGCLACRDGKHSKAYIHHLIKANELLAQILLFGHNLHQMLLLFAKLSEVTVHK